MRQLSARRREPEATRHRPIDSRSSDQPTAEQARGASKVKAVGARVCGNVPWLSAGGSAASRSQARADAIGRRITTPGPRLSTKAAPRVSPRYRDAIASRASRTTIGSPSRVTRPATLTPRNGGTVSKTVNTARSSTAMRRSFESSAATTTSNAESVQRYQTGETSAEPSAR
jgi:hypothetical protein